MQWILNEEDAFLCRLIHLQKGSCNLDLATLSNFCWPLSYKEQKSLSSERQQSECGESVGVASMAYSRIWPEDTKKDLHFHIEFVMHQLLGTIQNTGHRSSHM